jgi:pteridine reductase
VNETDASLSGKTVLITGGARRVGAAIARRLHGAGANLVVHYRNSSRDATELADRMNSARAKSAAIFQADLLDIARLPELVEFAVRSFGALDVLVNNASTFYATKIGEVTPAAWDDLMGSNLKAPLFLSQAAAPALKKAHGLILNIVDIHALRPLRSYTVYCAAKAGLHMLTRSLAKELGPEVRVNGISPGPVLWPEKESDPAAREKIIQRTILQKMGTPEDIARTALFFAAHAPFITGQILAVDGGRSVAW